MLSFERSLELDFKIEGWQQRDLAAKEVIATTGPSCNALDDPCRVRTHVLLAHVFDMENGNIR